ncbi:hypothetical protein [Labedaea rhizosphaerae]|uniref:Excreted virulence factor EspC (Type VII ESX diderm) n=1 Tax=Labedaea rhizosphaerae TaxID=598644 RepID=A0A4R6SNI7_LABRH|nr:hypothetical protein [Labedaea rhizosphaerae]TDQ05491.1 hypothetical protein EV186_1011462 [Labedaea rhizosphaerae]
MRIDSKAEAERVWRQQHHGSHKPQYDKPTMAHADHTDKNISGVGMDGIEVTPEDLIQADKDLAAAQAELLDHIERAKQLHGPLGDGHGPVAKNMAATFLDRAGAQSGGVKAALWNYHNELGNVRAAIAQTLSTYESVDSGVAEYLSRQSSEGQA